MPAADHSPDDGDSPQAGRKPRPRAAQPEPGEDRPTARQSDRGAKIERHIQTVLVSLTTASIFFVADYVYKDNRAGGMAQVQLQALTTQVVEMREDLRALQNSYTALMTNYARKEDVKELDARVRNLESKRR